MRKEIYQSPSIEVVEIQLEGAILSLSEPTLSDLTGGSTI